MVNVTPEAAPHLEAMISTAPGRAFRITIRGFG